MTGQFNMHDTLRIMNVNCIAFLIDISEGNQTDIVCSL